MQRQRRVLIGIGLLATFVSFRPVCAQNLSGWKIAERHGSTELYCNASVSPKEIWKQVDEVTQELENALGIRATDEPVQIVIFATHREYQRYLVQRLPQARTRPALFYRNGDVSQVYAWNSRSLITDLRHEMTHVRIHQHLPFVPLWLDEGLAEYFEEQPQNRTSSSRISSVKWKARMGATPDLRSLEKIPSAEQMDGDAYRDSWAWTGLLLNESAESAELLREYIHEIHRGEAPGPFSRFAEAGNPELMMRANSYFRKMTIRLAFDSSRE